jgi:GT2 family glycosyltransferase
MLPTKRPLVFVVILNWNGWKDTIECLESVISQSYSDYRIVLCDNNSNDNSIEQIIKWADRKTIVDITRYGNLPNVKIINSADIIKFTEIDNNSDLTSEVPLLTIVHTGDNLGFTGGNNVGIEFAIQQKAGYVWLLNNDTIVSSTCLEEMVKVIENNPKIGALGSKIYYADEPNKIWFAGSTFNPYYGQSKVTECGIEDDEINLENDVEAAFITGCSILVPTVVMEKIGYLDDDYFFGVEDLDFSLRVQQFGYKCMVARKSQLWHKVSGSTGGMDSPVYTYYFLRNRLILMKKHARLYHWPVFLMHYLASYIIKNTIISIVNRRSTNCHIASYLAIKDFVFGKFGKASSKNEKIFFAK